MFRFHKSTQTHIWPTSTNTDSIRLLKTTWYFLKTFRAFVRTEFNSGRRRAAAVQPTSIASGSEGPALHSHSDLDSAVIKASPEIFPYLCVTISNVYIVSFSPMHEISLSYDPFIPSIVPLLSGGSCFAVDGFNHASLMFYSPSA